MDFLQRQGVEVKVIPGTSGTNTNFLLLLDFAFCIVIFAKFPCWDFPPCLESKSTFF